VCTHPSEKYSILLKAQKLFVTRLHPHLLGEHRALPQAPLVAFDGPTPKRGRKGGRRCYALPMEKF